MFDWFGGFRLSALPVDCPFLRAVYFVAGLMPVFIFLTCFQSVTYEKSRLISDESLSGSESVAGYRASTIPNDEARQPGAGGRFAGVARWP